MNDRDRGASFQYMRHFSQVRRSTVLRFEVLKCPCYGFHGKIEHAGNVFCRNFLFPGVEQVIQFVEIDSEKELLVADREAESIGAGLPVNNLGNDIQVSGYLINLVLVNNVIIQ